MQHYLQMYKNQHTPQRIKAVRALVKANAVVRVHNGALSTARLCMSLRNLSLLDTRRGLCP
jgi:hypothetical protein